MTKTSVDVSSLRCSASILTLPLSLLLCLTSPTSKLPPLHQVLELPRRVLLPEAVIVFSFFSSADGPLLLESILPVSIFAWDLWPTQLHCSDEIRCRMLVSSLPRTYVLGSCY